MRVFLGKALRRELKCSANAGRSRRFSALVYKHTIYIIVSCCDALAGNFESAAADVYEL